MKSFLLVFGPISIFCRRVVFALAVFSIEDGRKYCRWLWTITFNARYIEKMKFDRKEGRIGDSSSSSSSSSSTRVR